MVLIVGLILVGSPGKGASMRNYCLGQVGRWAWVPGIFFVGLIEVGRPTLMWAAQFCDLAPALNEKERPTGHEHVRMNS